LAVAVVALPFYIGKQKEELDEKRLQKLNPPVKPLPALEETRYTAILQRVEKPMTISLSKPHNLFNPIAWQRAADGHLIKLAQGNEVGPEALKVAKVSPLHTTIRFESIGVTGSNYLISVTREAAPLLKDRRKKSFYVEVGTKNDMMSVVAVEGAADKPSLAIIMADTGEKISVSIERPFLRVDGHTVDLRYEPEKGNWAGRRVNDKVYFAGDEFTITAINLIATNEFEVVISAKSTGKKTPIKFNSEM
jgi:hypothetical protein